jgi:hypothetical protein
LLAGASLSHELVLAASAISRQAAYIIYLASGRSLKRQEKYFPMATRILDEAIMLGSRNSPGCA